MAQISFPLGVHERVGPQVLTNRRPSRALYKSRAGKSGDRSARNDEHVVALIHAHARHPGKTLDGNEADVYNMKGGQVTEFWSLDEDQYASDEFFS